jgi:quercetin dioxygenase-like cupin family protein
MITRRDVVVAAVAALAASATTGAAVALAQAPAKPVMHSSVFDWASFKAEATKTGSRRECLDARTATMERLETHVTTLNPGEMPHPPHKHPEEELIVVKEGVLEATQNEKPHRVEAGGLIFQASNEMHGLRNIGKTPAVYYVIKFVPPGLAAAHP